MTTRRLPRALPPPRGLIGLFGRGGMRGISVEAPQRRWNFDGLFEDAVERTPGAGAVDHSRHSFAWASQPRCLVLRSDGCPLDDVGDGLGRLVLERRLRDDRL